MSNEPNSLGGRCVVLDGVQTRESLLARGLTPAGADEILRFQDRLLAKAAAKLAASQGEGR